MPSTQHNSSVTDTVIASLRDSLTAPSFKDWHRLQERQRNRAEGYDDTRNNPAHTPDHDTHSPSSLLDCHRMAYYRANNAPRENNLPYGIFKFGHDFEDYIETFLTDHVTPANSSVRNPVRVKFTTNNLTFEGTKGEAGIAHISGCRDSVTLIRTQIQHSIWQKPSLLPRKQRSISG